MKSAIGSLVGLFIIIRTPAFPASIDIGKLEMLAADCAKSVSGHRKPCDQLKKSIRTVRPSDWKILERLSRYGNASAGSCVEARRSRRILLAQTPNRQYSEEQALRREMAHSARSDHGLCGVLELRLYGAIYEIKNPSERQSVAVRMATEGESVLVRRCAARWLGSFQNRDTQSVLSAIALGDQSRSVREEAIGNLSDQEFLLKVIMESYAAPMWAKSEEKVLVPEPSDTCHMDCGGKWLSAVEYDRGLVFTELRRSALIYLANKATTPALRLAAEVRIGREGLLTLFEAAARQQGGLANAAGALSLLESFSLLEGTEHTRWLFTDRAKDAVTAACEDLIRHGSAGQLEDKELLRQLLRYGEAKLAVAFLNSGDRNLRAAATSWAETNGYTVRSVFTGYVNTVTRTIH